jgi:hypothetical protein
VPGFGKPVLRCNYIIFFSVINFNFLNDKYGYYQTAPPPGSNPSSMRSQDVLFLFYFFMYDFQINLDYFLKQCVDVFNVSGPDIDQTNSFLFC